MSKNSTLWEILKNTDVVLALNQAKDEKERDEIIAYAWVTGRVRDPDKPCGLAETLLGGNSTRDMFNSKFVLTLINHIGKCEECFVYYMRWSDERYDKGTTDSKLNTE